jgi:vacuolar-type H+-ATPase subunit H
MASVASVASVANTTNPANTTQKVNNGIGSKALGFFKSGMNSVKKATHNAAQRIANATKNVAGEAIAKAANMTKKVGKAAINKGRAVASKTAKKAMNVGQGVAKRAIKTAEWTPAGFVAGQVIRRSGALNAAKAQANSLMTKAQAKSNELQQQIQKIQPPVKGGRRRTHRRKTRRRRLTKKM